MGWISEGGGGGLDQNNILWEGTDMSWNNAFCY